MSKFGVMIKRKNKNEEGFPIVVTEKALKTYRRDHDFIIKFGLTESEALEMKNCIEESLINMHKSTKVNMKELVANVFFGGE